MGCAALAWRPNVMAVHDDGTKEMVPCSGVICVGMKQVMIGSYKWTNQTSINYVVCDVSLLVDSSTRSTPNLESKMHLLSLALPTICLGVAIGETETHREGGKRKRSHTLTSITRVRILLLSSLLCILGAVHQRSRAQGHIFGMDAVDFHARSFLQSLPLHSLATKRYLLLRGRYLDYGSGCTKCENNTSARFELSTYSLECVRCAH